MSEKLPYQEQLKILREKNGTNKDLMESVKMTNKIHKLIMESLATGPKTIPEIALETKLESEVIFWHVNALRKYGKIVDGGKTGDYWKYSKVEK
jgi:predicted transcriptional regulator